MEAEKRRATGFQSWAIAAGLLTAPFYLTLIIVLGALEPDFTHCTSLMSVLGGVPGLRGFVFNLGVGMTGALVLTFGVGLNHELPARWTTRVGFVLLVIGGVGLIGAGAFPCNQGCRNILAAPNLVGRLHIGASFLAGMGTALAPFFFAATMRRSATWKRLATPTLVAAILANLPGIALWLSLMTGYRLHSVEGAFQRLGFIIILIWIFFVAVGITAWKRRWASAPRR